MTFTLNITHDKVAHLLFDLKDSKVNTFSPKVVDELEEKLDQLANEPVKALVISSGKKGTFIAGADLKSFEPAFKNPEIARELIEKGHRVFRKLEKLPFPTIAVIHGACLGGGLEFALTCDYRIVTDDPKTSLGLPEVNLGIFPGWGGTQRLPRLIGLKEALKMILSGKPVDGNKAFKIGLADQIVPYEFINERVAEFVQNPKRKRAKKGFITKLLENNPIGRSLLFSGSKRQVLKQTKGHYPAPIRALEVVSKTHSLPLKKGLKKEREMFIGSIDKEFIHAPALIRLFFVSESLKKGAVSPMEITKTGVIGSGTMGAGIAWLLSYRGYSVRMKDINWKAVGNGYGIAWKTYQTLVRLRKLKSFEAIRKFHRLTGTVDYSGFSSLDFVIEAAVENFELKQKIYQELEAVMKPNAVIASNTSSLMITELASGLKHPERLVGLHFFNPPSRMPLVEVVKGEKTDPAAIEAAVYLCQQLKKTPIVVKDCPGFLVNRIFAQGMNEAAKMLQSGTDIDLINRSFLSFGMPMAPFVLADVVGNDVNYRALKQFEKAYGERQKVPKILVEMYEKGWYGDKVGKGFYVDKKINPELPALIESIGENAPETHAQDVLDRALLAMINEASRCLEEEVVTDPAHLDMALIMGIGFPPFTGGLLRYADQIGLKTIKSKLKSLEEKHGPRFTPSKWIEEEKEFYNDR
ncbi:MAG: 3-hydroxyacyl-CoA dehydrogenase NAD-binding domain-containing protein [Waddliaceae bacterium]